MTIKDIENLQPGESGIITLVIEGNVRRFAKDKLLSFLGKFGPAAQISATIGRTPAKPRTKKKTRSFIKSRAPGEHTKANKVAVVKKPRGTCNRQPIVAILPDGTEKNFISSLSAARELNIYKSGVSRVLNAKLTDVRGVKFRFTKTQTSNQPISIA